MLIILTLLSTSLALVMSAVAWRTASGERRRSEARVAALAQAIHAPDDLVIREERSAEAFPLQDGRSAEAFALQDARSAEAFALRGSPDLFTAVEPVASGPRYAVALAAAGFVVASIAAAAIVFSGGSPTAPPARSGSPAAAADVQSAVPLELVALSHERSGSTLTIRGVVRNPAGGSAMDRLMAVVFVFDPDGGFLASGRTALESPAIIPGGESTFVVTVPIAADIGRYRVSFRSGDRIVAHLDKRSRP